MFLKYPEQAERMSLWAWICLSPQLRVQSNRFSSSLKSLKDPMMFRLKSFHFRQNFSSESVIFMKSWGRIQGEVGDDLEKIPDSWQYSWYWLIQIPIPDFVVCRFQCAGFKCCCGGFTFLSLFGWKEDDQDHQYSTTFHDKDMAYRIRMKKKKDNRY